MSVFANNIDVLRFKVDATIVFRVLDGGDISDVSDRIEELRRLYDTKNRWLLMLGCGEELWFRWLEFITKG